VATSNPPPMIPVSFPDFSVFWTLEYSHAPPFNIVLLGEDTHVIFRECAPCIDLKARSLNRASLWLAHINSVAISGTSFSWSYLLFCRKMTTWFENSHCNQLLDSPLARHSTLNHKRLHDLSQTFLFKLCSIHKLLHSTWQFGWRNSLDNVSLTCTCRSSCYQWNFVPVISPYPSTLLPQDVYFCRKFKLLIDIHQEIALFARHLILNHKRLSQASCLLKPFSKQ
jgi:hypothetical protein